MPGPAATRMAIASTKAPSGTRARIRRTTLAFNAVLPSTSGRAAAGPPTLPPRVVATRANAQAVVSLQDFDVVSSHGQEGIPRPRHPTSGLSTADARRAGTTGRSTF